MPAGLSCSPGGAEGGPFVFRHPAGSERISPYCFPPRQRQPRSPGRGLAPAPGVARAEGTWKVSSPLTQPNRAGITCSVGSQRAKAFFTVFCSGTTPSPRIEKPQHARAMEKLLLCCSVPGGGLRSSHSSRSHGRGRGASLEGSGREEAPQVALNTNSFTRDLKTGIKAVPARWAQLSHSSAGRKKKLIVTCSALINLPRLSSEGTESKVSSLVPVLILCSTFPSSASLEIHPQRMSASVPVSHAQ